MDQQTKQEIEILHQQVCVALADPTRIMIIFLLAQEPMIVNDISEELDLPQSTISRHLKVLRERGLVVATRNGTSVSYALADIRLLQALELLRGVLHDRVLKHARLIQDKSVDQPPDMTSVS